MPHDTSPSLQPPRGMRDFYPEEMALRSAIFGAWRAASEMYGFREYDSCVVESLDLLKRKSGDEIVEQIYAFKDKSDRDLALRPEMTPSLARMVAARQGALSFPLKWSTIAQCFRYERATRGRKREHYQWNLDVIGESSVTAETEVIAAAVDALFRMGLCPEDFVVLINSRALLSDLFAHKGIPSDAHQAVFLALDKRAKLGDEKTAVLLKEGGLDEDTIKSAMEVTALSSLDDARGMLPPDNEAIARLDSLFAMLSEYGIDSMVEFDVSIVRGLGYYTGVVFEAFDRKREFRALFGGGRYDNLLSEIGGKPMTGVGLGFGDVVVAELLSDLGRGSAAEERRGMAVGYMAEEHRPAAAALAASIRKQGVAVDLALQPQKAKALFSHANKGMFREAAYVGPDDVARGSVRIKNLEDGTEREEQLPTS